MFRDKTASKPEVKNKLDQSFFYFEKKLVLAVFFIMMFTNTAQAQLIPPKSQTVKTSGDIILVALPISSLATTLILKDYKGTWQFTKSALLNGAITYGLKYGINKPRPFDGGPYAFPSGHTSATFQAASFIHRRYGFKYSIPGYALAAWTGYSRINATRHDGWDVVAGAAIGIGSSFFFTKPRQRENMDLSFKSWEDGWLVSFSYKF